MNSMNQRKWEGSFIVRRWSTAEQGYVTSSGASIVLTDVNTMSRLPTLNYQAATPLKDGSAPFLDLPCEVRLRIYDFLKTEEDVLPRCLSGFGSHLQATDTSNLYAFLYRSPGRSTKPRGTIRQMITLSHVCRQLRSELVDSCFKHQDFILEACLYSKDTAGLKVLPPNLGLTAWVKRLLLLTVVEMNGKVRHIADLRPLQQMTSLEKLVIVFTRRGTYRGPSSRTILDQAVLKAVIECVPVSATISFEVDESSRQQLSSQLGQHTMDFYDLEGRYSRTAMDSVNTHLERLLLNKGRLSGNPSDHSGCRRGLCQTQAFCVNSRLGEENTLASVSDGLEQVDQSGSDQDPRTCEKGVMARLKTVLRHK